MPKPNHVLSFATNHKGQLFIHADAAGLDHLIQSLTHLRRAIDEDDCPHYHFMSDRCGGSDLSERTLDQGTETIYHVKIYGWTPEWVEKHGLAK